jgi:hypothetical protein
VRSWCTSNARTLWWTLRSSHHELSRPAIERSFHSASTFYLHFRFVSITIDIDIGALTHESASADNRGLSARQPASNQEVSTVVAPERPDTVRGFRELR